MLFLNESKPWIIGCKKDFVQIRLITYLMVLLILIILMMMKAVLLQTCAEETLAKADAALRQREEELQRLGVEHQALGAELAAVKEGLCSSTERAEKLLEEGQVVCVCVCVRI